MEFRQNPVIQSYSEHRWTSLHGSLTEDEQSKKNADDLDRLWEQEQEKETEKIRNKMNMSNHDKMMVSHDISACITELGDQEFSEANIPLDGRYQSPMTTERTQLSGMETPQKLNYSAKTEVSTGVKRKLNFSED